MLLRVHWQFDALRIVLYDQHPCHATSEKSEERRSADMWLLAAALDAHGGPGGSPPR
ncbi:hypothetical protein P8A22_04330 [Streptomyces laculatispora]|uniref:Transposase n=1 Tax=Streptomyces laculatispora TaxID=887464 RepID=A0ABY9HXL8_9ACTN|nr:hypothetical protein [Streptomyces laculatispora]WLQ39321.1 hypothetical protein P8A22_04330 [Streptomyces laculatispora]